MKSSNLIKKVSKISLINQRVDIGNNVWFSAQTKHRVIEWHVSWNDVQEDVASCVRVRSINDHDDLVSDYNAGCYYDTIKSAMTSFMWEPK